MWDRLRRYPAVCAGGFYAALAAVIGRHLLAAPASTVAPDPGDPLLNAAILSWTSTHVPLTDAWWRLPIFHPTPDALAFSEHLLGISAIFAPLQGVSGDVLVAYNLTFLLTYPLSALAMFAVVRQLTGDSMSAFVAGLAFGFAPYRVSQQPHIQVLAIFWAPLAFLALHRYVTTCRSRWLVLFAAAFALQGLANGYFLVFLSVPLALWVAWFVAARRDWRALLAIGFATMAAVLPLLPILIRYQQIHAFHGLTRSVEEIRFYSADAAALLCADPSIVLWGWLRSGCVREMRLREVELFPGAALAILVVLGIILAIRRAPGGADPDAIPGADRDVREHSCLRFYLIAALVSWLMTLGPVPSLMGRASGYPGPYAALLWLPGVDSLRVPARFWPMTVLCLAIAVGVTLARMTRGQSRRARLVMTSLAAVGVMSDAWTGPIAAADVLRSVPNAELLKGRTVLELPMQGVRDIGAEFRALAGGWRSVNGFSGYEPRFYRVLDEAQRREADGLIQPFQDGEELHVLVSHEAPRLGQVVERQPGVRATARDDRYTQYVLPKRTAAGYLPQGEKRRISSVRSRCANGDAANVFDGTAATRWRCGPLSADEELIIDLGAPVVVGAVVYALGPYYSEFPHALALATSNGGNQWETAWDGNVLGDVIREGLRDWTTARIVLPFAPRTARYVRVSHPYRTDPPFFWSVPEIEIWSDWRAR